MKAVQIMYHAIKNTPHSYSLLHVQSDLLRTKGRPDWAIKLASESVNCAPTEFSTWAKLTECHIELENWEEVRTYGSTTLLLSDLVLKALFTLNSCPMFTYNERDLHRMPTPARTHFPIKSYIAESGLLDDENTREDEADVALLRLPAPALRGTFAKAYSLLSKLVSKIGWDELLRCRSQVFVMEEEYRAQKSRSDISPSAAQSDNAGDDDTSTWPITHSTEKKIELEESTAEQSSSVEKSQDSETQEDDVAKKLSSLGVSDPHADSSSHSIPTIKISTESDHEREKLQVEGFIKARVDGDASGRNGVQSAPSVRENDSEQDESQQARVPVEAPPLEKPATAQAQAQAEGGHNRSNSLSQATEGREGANQQDSSLPTQSKAEMSNAIPHEQDTTTVGSLSSNFSFSNKRLCERWLDNLFMVLYEDLRVYTIWRAEVSHYKAQSIPYRKTSSEWEILGELALRLNHREEAKDAFQRCVDAKFSAKSYLRLLDMYTEERDVERSLWTALRLTAYHHRWYTEGTYPSAVARCLFRLIREVGLAKVNFTLVSMNPPDPILRISKSF